MLSQLAAYLADTLQLENSHHVIDLGCGEAELTNAIAGYAGAVSGVDHDEAALTNANVRDNVTLIRGSMTALHALPLKPAQHVLAYNAFQYLSNDDEALAAFRGIHALIPAGGCFYIGAVLDQDAFGEFTRTWGLTLQEHNINDRVGRGWYPGHLCKLAEKAGFQPCPLPLLPRSLQLLHRFDYLFKKVG